MRMPTLQPYDHSRLRITCHDGDLYYGADIRSITGFGTAKVCSYNPRTGAEAVVHDFGTTEYGDIQMVWYEPTDGVMFCIIDGAGARAGHSYIMRAVAPYTTWTEAWDNTLATRVMLTPESFARCDMADGSVVYYIAEYTTGATDPRLLKSTDRGRSWSVYVTWTAAQVRHFHALKWHPVLKRLFIGFGDSITESGVLDWDPAGGDLSAATAPNAYATAYAVGYAGYNYKPCTLILGRDRTGAYNGWLYWTLDVASSQDHRGIMRAQINQAGPGLSNLQRLAKFRQGSIGLCGFCTDDGRFVMFEGADQDASPAATANWKTWVWTSDNGLDFEATSCMNNVNPSSPFQWAAGVGPDGRIFIQHKGGAAKQDGQQDTLFCEWGDPDPDGHLSIIHPVFWVAPTGTNVAMTPATHGGWSRFNPLRDPAYAAANNTSGYGGAAGGGKLSPGSRVQVAAGTYQVPYCLGTYAASSPAGEDGVPVEFHGEGRASTIWEHTTGAFTSFSIGSTTTPKTRMKRLTLRNTLAQHLLTTAASGTSLDFYDCQVGPTGSSSNRVCTFTTTNTGQVYGLYRSIQAVIAGGDGVYAGPGAAGDLTVTMRQSLCIGGARAVRRANTAGTFTLDVENTAFAGQSGHGINLESSATVAGKRIRGCNFHGQGNAPLGNSAALTFTLAECDYNYVGANVAGVFDVAGHHNTVTTSQGLTYSTTAYTYAVSASSVLRGKYTPLRGDVLDLEGTRLAYPLPVGCIGDAAVTALRCATPSARTVPPVTRAAAPVSRAAAPILRAV